MNLDHLLLWLSAKGQGSWSVFRGAVEALCATQESTSSDKTHSYERIQTSGSALPDYQRARFALQQLGHVEFARQPARDWRVVPPTLVLQSRNRDEGLLCGARSPDLLDELAAALEVTRTATSDTPARIVVRGSTEALAPVVARLNIRVQMDAPTAILSAAPGVRDQWSWTPSEIPETTGWSVHRFSASRLAWAESSGGNALRTSIGLFRFVMGYQRFHYLRWQGYSYRVPVQVGKFAVMRRTRGLLAYKPSSLTLSVPAACRPPLLIERALTLCSGLLPAFEPVSRRLEYPNVPPEVACLAAQLLRQEVSC